MPRILDACVFPDQVVRQTATKLLFGKSMGSVPKEESIANVSN